MKASLTAIGILVSICGARAELIGHWKLQGDARDHSGNGNHGVSHGAGAERGEFNGRDAYISVAPSKSLRLGAGDFSVAAWVHTEKDLDDVLGDIFEMYDPAQRRGITLTLNSSGSGYSGQGNDRQVVFGIDNGKLSEWADCGKPSPTSDYISNSMMVYDGKLIVGTTDARDTNDWCHVFAYEGGQKWKDLGRVGGERTTGVGPLVAHDGKLYAVTRTYDWTRVSNGPYDAGRMFRYAGGTNWIDCGQVSDSRTLNTVASYKGKLYVGGGPETWGVWAWSGEREWTPSQVFEKAGERRCFPHAMSRYNGKLFVGYPGVYSFDGARWEFAGSPAPNGTAPLQLHSFAVYRGELLAGTWPDAIVASYSGGEKWESIGRVGVDGTEVNALTVYNGKLYGGSIPRAEVCRYESGTNWMMLKRFHSAKENWKPGLPGKAKRNEVNEWGRVTTLAVADGKLFAGLGNCTSAIADTIADPGDIFGKVFSMEAGKCVSYDRDIGPGWKHIAAVRDGGVLKIFVNGEEVAASDRFTAKDFDLSVDQPLRIGFGQTDYFNGKISDVRLYNDALSARQIRKLSANAPR